MRNCKPVQLMLVIASVIIFISTAGDYKLILNHKDVFSGYFDAALATNGGIENENNPDANTYSIIGNLDPDDFKDPSDDKYQFKLIYNNIDGTVPESYTLIWKQSAWITSPLPSGSSTVLGYEAINIPSQTCHSNQKFAGLSLNNYYSSYSWIKGTNNKNFRNSVGTFQFANWLPESILGFNAKYAKSQSLYIYEPDKPDTYTCPLPPCESCTALDILFLLDESGSIDLDEWKNMTNFVSRLIKYDINELSYVSLIEYGSIADFEQFVDFSGIGVAGNRDLIINALENNNYVVGGETFIGDAIKRSIAKFNEWDAVNDVNNERNNLLFVLTDGNSNDEICPDLQDIFENNNVEIVIIGIGVDVDSTWSDVFYCIYDDKESDTFYIESFEEDDFNAKEVQLRSKTCQYSSTSCSYLELESQTLSVKYIEIINIILFIALSTLFVYFCVKAINTKNQKYVKTLQDDPDQ